MSNTIFLTIPVRIDGARAARITITHPENGKGGSFTVKPKGRGARAYVVPLREVALMVALRSFRSEVEREQRVLRAERRA